MVSAKPYFNDIAVTEPFIEKRINMCRMKLIDILSNFTVADDYLGELIDASKIDSALRDKMVSVIKEVAGDVFPLYENFTGAEAKEFLSNSNDSDTMKEIVKFACAVYPHCSGNRAPSYVRCRRM